MLGAMAVLIASLAFTVATGGGSLARAAELGSSSARPAAGERPLPDLRELDRWLQQRAQTQMPMPTEARLAYRRGLIAWRAHQEPQAVSLLRGAANLDPSFVAPHLTLGWWFLTREPSQTLLSWASFLHRLRALFFGLLGAALILVALHQHELRHVWSERLGIALSPRSAVIWSWVFLVMPWLLGLGLALPALVMLAMAWPILKARERAVFVALAVLVGTAPLAPTLLGRLALPLSADGSPFYGVIALDQRDNDAEAHDRVARLAAAHPDSPYLQFAHGWLARRAGDLEGAEAAYRRALKQWPNNAEASNNLGNILAMEGRFDDALATFGRATQADARDAAAFFNASQVHTRLFDYRAASEAVARASALDFEMVKSYQARSGESGDLPLVDQWIDPATIWRTLLHAPNAEVVPALPVAWRSMIETSGWPFAITALVLALGSLAFGVWSQIKIPLRACSNCGRPVCRRCAQRLREVALCPNCSVIAARAESGEFGRVLLLGRRRQVERGRSIARAIGAGLVPGLGLLARRRVWSALLLLSSTAHVVSRWLDLRAPFWLTGDMVQGAGGPEWGLTLCAVVVYTVSVLGYLWSPDPDAPSVRVTASRPGSIHERPARAA
ncbi:MAG: tetratricopeptide repeat protein [Candidatus Eisenbacteria bacterium]|uniref:Tetratricopeptide repeat protein n=1 Tax=Eiseniibacteriota bacterium TaxID=2212470 RepID=A0A538U6E6_UNCEI|nr:MAG: tetratricopeptide repeat protein [Candidatus Eisenbacteria bacterium]